MTKTPAHRFAEPHFRSRRLGGSRWRLRRTRCAMGEGLSLIVLNSSLQGIAERPLPCNYNVIQPVSALSRRKRGFKSRRGRQITNLHEKRLLSV
jgi:hypothetical protein